MTSMRAIVVKQQGVAAVDTVDVPQPKPNEILVKVKAVTLNPTDWKHIKLLSPVGVTSGCDFCGTVETAHPASAGNAVAWKKGDRVAGYLHGGFYPGWGSFAEYLHVGADQVTRIPDNVSDEVASSVGIGGFTAAQALFDRLRLKLPLTDATSLPVVNADSPKLLVWAGSTSVGQWAIQLGRAAGYYVITTASPKNHELLKRMGAAETHDYRDAGTPEAIAKKHSDLNAALDCISENGTQSLAVRSLGISGGKVVVLLKPEKEAVALRPEVKIIHTLIYTALGNPFTYGRAEFSAEQVARDKATLAPFFGEGVFYHLFRHGLVQGNQIKHMDGGLDGVLEGLKYLEEGKVSAEKLAYTL